MKAYNTRMEYKVEYLIGEVKSLRNEISELKSNDVLIIDDTDLLSKLNFSTNKELTDFDLILSNNEEFIKLVIINYLMIMLNTMLSLMMLFFINVINYNLLIFCLILYIYI